MQNTKMTHFEPSEAMNSWDINLFPITCHTNNEHWMQMQMTISLKMSKHFVSAIPLYLLTSKSQSAMHAQHSMKPLNFTEKKIPHSTDSLNPNGIWPLNGNFELKSQWKKYK